MATSRFAIAVFKLSSDRKSTRLNSSHTEIYTLSLHDALPILEPMNANARKSRAGDLRATIPDGNLKVCNRRVQALFRSEEHTSELQSHRDLHSFPTRRSSDLGTYERERSEE